MIASPEAKFTKEKISWIKHHTPKLTTFAISRSESYRFSAEQFSRLGFRDDEGFTWHAYSVASAEYADTLEYFAVLIEGGPMPVCFAAMKEGDIILSDKTATDFLLPERFPDGKDLVMLCTGSGIASFLSIIEQPETWQRFGRSVLAHSISYADELIFNQRLVDLKEHPLIKECFHKFTFVPATTREETGGALSGKWISELLKNGGLEIKISPKFTKADTCLMVCGNPAMVKDTFQTLMNLGYVMHRNRIPGEVMMENGF